VADPLTATDVDRLLADAAREIEDPPHDLTPQVMARLAEEPATRVASTAAGRFRASRVVGAGLAVVAVLVAVVLITPSSRDAVADWFGLGG
jgi:hypothetical protein